MPADPVPDPPPTSEPPPTFAVPPASAGPSAAQRLAKRVRVPMGFVVAVLFLWRARPSGWSLALSLLLVVPGLALRAYAAGYVRKNAELTTSGPYAYTRNPLYLGSLLIVLGFGAASCNWLLCLLLAALFGLIYIPTIQGEEQFLRATFPGFPAYARAVPRLLPRLTPARFAPQGAISAEQPPVRARFSPERYRHHREYNALMGAGAIYVVLLLELAVRHRRG